MENLPAPDLRQPREVSASSTNKQAQHLVVDAGEVAVEPRGDDARAGGQTALRHRQRLAQDHIRVQLHDPLQSPKRLARVPPTAPGGQVVGAPAAAPRSSTRAPTRGHEVQVFVRRERALVARQKTRHHTGTADVSPAPSTARRSANRRHASQSADVVVIINLATFLGGNLCRRRPTFLSCRSRTYVSGLITSAFASTKPRTFGLASIPRRDASKDPRARASASSTARARCGRTSPKQNHPQVQQRDRGELSASVAAAAPSRAACLASPTTAVPCPSYP